MRSYRKYQLIQLTIIILIALSGTSCREDDPAGKAIEGLWEVESQEYIYGDLENKRSLLTLQDGIFLCTAFEIQSGKVTRTHGGPYAFDGETLHLTFSFASESIEQSIVILLNY